MMESDASIDAGTEMVSSGSIFAASALPSEAGLPFGDYVLEMEIAHGGMGVVYRARQLSLNRVVALKLLLLGRYSSAESIERFRREAQSAAALRHPNIVSIHEVGEHDGQHFFSMEYVEGRNLAEILREGPLEPLRAAEICRIIARAIHYAHEQGVLHRDLKPSNVIVDILGQVRITDFGLAKKLDGSSDLTVTGQMVGTPNYLSPEQAAGNQSELSPASDVYSIGAVLYEILTGRPPFLANSLQETLLRIRDSDPVSPRAWNPTLHRDLDTICLKCLRKEPERRYPNAQALADDLDRWLRHLPISARPIAGLERAWLWCKRRPNSAMLLLTLFTVVAAGFIGVFSQWKRAEAEASRANREFTYARKTLNRLRLESYAADLKAADVALKGSNLGHALEILRRYLPNQGEPDLREITWRYLWQASRRDEVRTFWHDSLVGDAALSRNGKLLATACFDGKVRVWEAASGAKAAEFAGTKVANPEQSLAFSPDDTWLAIGRPGGVTIRETTSWKNIRELEGGDSGVLFSPDGQTLASIRLTGVTLWDTRNWKRSELPLRAAAVPYARAAFSPDSEKLAVNLRSQEIEVWDLPSRARSSYIQGLAGPTSLAISPNNRWLALGNNLGELLVWDLINEQVVARMRAHTNWFFGLAFSPSANVLATGGSDQVIHFWEVPSGTSNSGSWRRLSTVRGHLQEIWSLSFSGDGHWLASASKDRTAKLWSTAPQADPVFELTTPPGSRVIGFSRNSEHLLTLNRAGRIQFASVALGNRGHQATRSGAGPAVPQQASRDTPDEPSAGNRLPEDATFYQGGAFPIYLGDETLVFGTTTGAVKFWNPNTGAIVATHQISTGSISVLQLSPDQRRIFVWRRSEQLAELWNLEMGEREAAFPDFARSKADERSMKRAAFSPDGRWLAYASTNYFVKVWEVAVRQPRFVLPAHAWTVSHLRFSPGSRILGTASWDGHARLWDLSNGTEKISLAPGYLGTVMTLSFSPDERTLVTSTSDSTVQFWSVDTGRHLLTLQDAFVEYETLIAPDGSSLVWEKGGVLRVTPLPALKDVDAAEAELAARR